MDDTLKTTNNDDDLVKHIVLIKKWIDQYDQFFPNTLEQVMVNTSC